MSKLEGKVAIVTGAGRGLGRAYALRVSSLGANVAVTDINIHSYQDYERERAAMTADTTADEIRAQGRESLAIECDVTDAAAVEAMVRKVHETWGHIDVAVCNAGGGAGKLTESKASSLDLKQTNEVLQRNLYGTIHTCVSVSPIMKEQHSGKVITVASQAGLTANADGSYAHYGSAKAGIIMYTRYLAQDLGPYGVTANCIAPGYIGTGRLMLGFEQQGVERIASLTALGRIGTPEDCAKVVEFLSTDLSDYVTGSVIPIDGGSIRGGAA